MKRSDQPFFALAPFLSGDQGYPSDQRSAVASSTKADQSLISSYGRIKKKISTRDRCFITARTILVHCSSVNDLRDCFSINTTIVGVDSLIPFVLSFFSASSFFTLFKFYLPRLQVQTRYFFPEFYLFIICTFDHGKGHICSPSQTHAAPSDCPTTHKRSE